MKLAILFLAPLLAAAQKSSGAPADDLARLQAEPNLEKRARAALNNAEEALKHARDAYKNGDTAAAESRLEEVEQSVALADSTLKQTGKNPSRSPKHFKYAELRTRDLLRKLDGFRDDMSVADRPALERVIATVQKIHDALLEGIMGKKK
jgi:hypothetical protein